MKNLHFLVSLFLPTLFLFSCFVSLVLSVDLQKQCLDDQRSALLQLQHDLYYAPNFIFSSKAMLWDLNTDCCSWKGITCDALGHVIGLDLSHKILSGSFHSVFNLHHLQRLNLAGNNFNATLLQYEFDRLPNLTHLNLSNSCFHGQIPIQISYFKRLVSLDLSHQDDCYLRYQQVINPYYYYDSLPFELQQPLKLKNPNFKTLIKNLRLLRELYLDSVKISTQSTQWCEATSTELPNLHVLSLLNCGLTSPLCSSLSRLLFLSKLFIGGNSISYLPSNFLEISSHLLSLNLANCNLSGYFPTKILSLPKMQSVDISENEHLAGQFPKFPLNNALRILLVHSTNFSGKLPESIGNLKFLTNLDISGCNFYGQIPSSIANLTNLVQVYLGSNSFSGLIPAFHRSGVPNIAHLSLDGNRLSGSIPSSLFTLPSLQTLFLRENQLVGEIPSSIANLTNLVQLDLGKNNISGLIPAFHRSGVPNLVHLSLDGNQLSGSIHSSLFTLPSLRILFLSENQLIGEINEFPNASSLLLTYLCLDHNHLRGSIPKSITQLPRLEELDISYNNFDSLKLDMFFQLKNLMYLSLSNMSLSIGRHNKSLTFPQLEVLSLRSCNLTEFPKFIKTQDNLASLDLSNNQIHGFVPNWLWKLSFSSLNLSSNMIDFPKRFPLGDVKSFVPMLKLLFLHSCNISIFPEFLKISENLEELDLSNNRISGAVPNWVWKKYLQYLDLSNNSLSSSDQFSQDQSLTSSRGSLSRSICNLSQLWLFNASYNKLSGLIPSCLGNISSLKYLDLQKNNFSGNIPDFAKASQLDTLQLNKNKLEGKLPRSLANCTYLQVLNVGNNNLYDTFPLWLGKLPALKVLILQVNRFYGPIKHVKYIFSALDVLDLSSNNFSGCLPIEFFQAPQLRSLKMGENKLEGKLPKTLANHRKLEVLDLGNNIIHDTFPFWLVKLPYLKVLVLRANRFYGDINISKDENAFPMLHILDLASNNFSGELSVRFFQSLKAMRMMTNGDKAKPDYIGDKYYQDSVTIVNKGFQIFYQKILTIFVCLDLSNNSFNGRIQEEIQNLKSLKMLNFSYNSFLGTIPSTLGNLSELESLDLSHNNLSGKIPLHLTSLTFLAVLNLSYNQLEGSIPQSFQFGTFSNYSYIGNPRLCGLPLTRKCNEVGPAMPPSKEYVDSLVDGLSDWKIVLMGYGCGLVIGFCIGYTVLNELGNEWFYCFTRNWIRKWRRSR